MATNKERSEEEPNYSVVMIFPADSLNITPCRDVHRWKLNAQNISNKCLVKGEII